MSEAVQALAELIQAQFEDWEIPGEAAVELAVFGTADPREMAQIADEFCREHLGAPIAMPLFYRSSIGSVFGLDLHDGRRVVVKVHQPDVEPGFLEAVHDVQRHLADNGFPCPRPERGPVPLRRGHATVDRYLLEGVFRNPHEPVVRRALVTCLGRQIALCRGFVDHPGFASSHRRRRRQESGKLWPKPHSALFDFEATAKGAEWIDEIAMQARDVLDAIPESARTLVVGHNDFSGKHLRFVGDTVRAVYDWDSLRIDNEAELVGSAAHAHTAMWDTEWEKKVPIAPSYEEVVSFAEEYGAARGVPFTEHERRAFGASCAYSLAYSARCGHSLDPRPGRVPDFEPGTVRHALATFGERLLEL